MIVNSENFSFSIKKIDDPVSGIVHSSAKDIMRSLYQKSFSVKEFRSNFDVAASALNIINEVDEEDSGDHTTFSIIEGGQTDYVDVGASVFAPVDDEEEDSDDG